MVNKLLGFYELRDSSLPSIPWRTYTPGTTLDGDRLWTIRSAVMNGNDLNLPRLVGRPARESEQFADRLYRRLGDRGMVVYYPYFVAHQSGTLEVSLGSVTIEAVADDLWNLVSEHKLNVSLTFDADGHLTSSKGDREFLPRWLLQKLLGYARNVRSMFRDDLLEGRSVLLEWSLASDCAP